MVNTGGLALVVSDATVYPTGFEVTLAVRLREVIDELDFFGRRQMRRATWPDGEIPPDVLRFGLHFADGSKATNVGGRDPWDADGKPEGPILFERGGGGGGTRYDQRFWAWPLPPAGELQFVCEWPSRDIGLTVKPIDAEVILAAASRAQELWPAPDLPERPSSAST